MLISLTLFVMLVLANGAPVVVAKVFRRRWSAPVDAGLHGFDGRPLLGKSKTWRGVVSGALCCGLFSLATEHGFLFGLLFGLLALAGDLFSSFIKRRARTGSLARGCLGWIRCQRQLFLCCWPWAGGWLMFGLRCSLWCFSHYPICGYRLYSTAWASGASLIEPDRELGCESLLPAGSSGAR